MVLEKILPNNLEEFKNFVQDNVFIISFIKRDGTPTTAIGTLSLNKIPTEKHPKGLISDYPTDTKVSFFNLDKNDWRSVFLQNVYRLDVIKNL